MKFCTTQNQLMSTFEFLLVLPLPVIPLPHLINLSQEEFHVFFSEILPIKEATNSFSWDNNKVFTSRDVTFYEHIFLYKMFTSPPPISTPIVHIQPHDPVTPSLPPLLPTPSSSLPPSSSTLVPPPLRRSSRPHQPPLWHTDYAMASSSTSCQNKSYWSSPSQTCLLLFLGSIFPYY